MDLSLKSLSLFIALTLTGLSSGLFLAWSISVIPGTQRASDFTYLETMQHINRGILNPLFFVVFMGSALSTTICLGLNWNTGGLFWGMFVAALLYIVGTFGVTAFANVPLNNELDALKISALTDEGLREFRNYYEGNWNKWHLIRTIAAVLSFIVLLFTSLFAIKS